VRELDDRCGVQRVVELPVAEPGEPVADDFAAGGFDGCGAGEAGEVMAAREAGDVADLAEAGRGDDGSDADDVGEVGAGRVDSFTDLLGDGLDLAIEDDDVVDRLDDHRPSGATCNITRADGCDELLGLVRRQSFGAPEGISSISIARSIRMLGDGGRLVPRSLLLAPLYGVLNLVLLVPLRFYSLLRLRDGSWGTRWRGAKHRRSTDQPTPAAQPSITPEARPQASTFQQRRLTFRDRRRPGWVIPAEILAAVPQQQTVTAAGLTEHSSVPSPWVAASAR